VVQVTEGYGMCSAKIQGAQISVLTVGFVVRASGLELYRKLCIMGYHIPSFCLHAVSLVWKSWGVVYRFQIVTVYQPIHPVMVSLHHSQKEPKYKCRFTKTTK
jgi:hypothetical protein